MPDYSPQGRGEPTARRGHEGADISVRKIFVATILLVIMLLVTHVALKGTLSALGGRPTDNGAANSLVPLIFGEQIPPMPRLQANPKEELVRLRGSQLGLLRSSGWSDVDRMHIHIPIEQAKILLLQRGLPRVGARPSPMPASLPEEVSDPNVR